MIGDVDEPDVESIECNSAVAVDELILLCLWVLVISRCICSSGLEVEEIWVYGTGILRVYFGKVLVSSWHRCGHEQFSNVRILID